MLGVVGPVVVASLLGSVHCAAMCGPFACLAAGRTRGAAAHLPYQLGRLVGYLALGLVAGGAGSLLNDAGRLAGVAELAGVAMALLLVGWGAATLLGLRPDGAALPPSWQQRIGGWLLRLERGAPAWRGPLTGLLTAVLPCGWLWVFVAVAAGSGTATTGAAVMAAFWLGSVPALVAVVHGMGHLATRWRRHLPQAAAVVVMLTGLLSLAVRLDLLPAGHWLHQVTPHGPVHGG